MADDKELKQEISNVIEAIVKNSDYSKMDLYQDMFKDRKTIIRNIFSRYISKIEGHSCSGDKASYIASGIEKTLTTGNNYTLQQTYREYRDNGGNIGGIKTGLDKQCYWCPSTIKDTNEALEILTKLVASVNYEPDNIETVYKWIINDIRKTGFETIVKDDAGNRLVFDSTDDAAEYIWKHYPEKERKYYALSYYSQVVRKKES